jgi:LAO/AO transport system kinase
MRDLSGDEGVFIRSMATRGALGGIARATVEAVQVLDAAGFDMILVETVGAGQSEVEIASLTQTTIVVEAPGLGDDIQAIKAGILEIADILVVNKADLPGADQTVLALRAMLNLGGSPAGELHHGFPTEPETPARHAETDVGWEVPVMRCIAIKREGAAELLRMVDAHYQYLRQSGELRRREWGRILLAFDRLVQQTLVERWRKSATPERIENVMQKLYRRELSPYQALDILVPETTPRLEVEERQQQR